MRGGTAFAVWIVVSTKMTGFLNSALELLAVILATVGRDADLLRDAARFLIEEESYRFHVVAGDIVAIQLPDIVTLEVADTAPVEQAGGHSPCGWGVLILHRSPSSEPGRPAPPSNGLAAWPRLPSAAGRRARACWADRRAWDAPAVHPTTTRA